MKREVYFEKTGCVCAGNGNQHEEKLSVRVVFWRYVDGLESKYVKIEAIWERNHVTRHTFYERTTRPAGWLYVRFNSSVTPYADLIAVMSQHRDWCPRDDDDDDEGLILNPLLCIVLAHFFVITLRIYGLRFISALIPSPLFIRGFFFLISQ